MAPLLGAGVLLVPSGRQAIIEGGLALSDRAAAASFRTSHLAPTYADADVTPLDRFPLNSYLAHDPELNLDRWRLLVEGLVSPPSAASARRASGISPRCAASPPSSRVTW